MAETGLSFRETGTSFMGSTSRSMTFGSTSRSRFRQEEEADIDALMQASMSMNTRHYPHVCATRGAMKMSRPAALTAGIDPAKDQEHQCPFFEAPRHRFAEIKNLPGGKPGTPTKSMKWRCGLAWADPDSHHSMKVTQTSPKAMSVTSRSTTLRGNSFFG